LKPGRKPLNISVADSIAVHRGGVERGLGVSGAQRSGEQAATGSRQIRVLEAERADAGRYSRQSLGARKWWHTLVSFRPECSRPAAGLLDQPDDAENHALVGCFEHVIDRQACD